MEEGFSELRADMRQMCNWLVWLFRDLILK